MNTLKHLINWVIWSIIALYALLMTVTHLTPCQQWLGRQVAHALEQKLATEVSVGRVDLGFLNRLIIDNVDIKDQRKRPMLNVGRLSVKIAPLSLAEGRIVISSAQVFGAHARLWRKDSLSAMNFQFVIDSLASKDSSTQAPLNLAINSLIVRRSSVDYDDYSAPYTKGILNLNHLKIKDISAHVILKTLTDDELSINVKRLTLKEHTGLTLSRLTFEAEHKGNDCKLRDFFLQLPHSSITIDQMVANADMEHIDETLRFSGTLDDVSITPVDLTFLSPKMANYKSPVKMRCSFEGTAQGIDVGELSLVSGDGNLLLNASGWIHQWDKTPTWHVSLQELKTTAELYETLKGDIDGLPEQLGRVGDVTLSGQATGHDNGVVDMNGLLHSGIGQLRLNGIISSRKRFDGHVETDGLQLDKLMNDEQLGLLVAAIDISGTRDAVGMQGQVKHFDFNGYAYKNMTVDGIYDKGNLSGKLTIDDPNIAANAEGELRQEQKTFTTKLSASITRLAPQALKLSEKWGGAVFSADIDADFTAKTLNDANGTLDIDNFCMTDTATNYRVENLHVKSGFDEGTHFLSLKGDMGEAELKGQFDWNTLPQSFIAYVASKLPTLPGLPQVTNTLNNDFNISLRLTDSEWMRHLLGINLRLEEPLSLEMSINDEQRKISVDGNMPLFSFNNNRYENGHISITSPADTMRCDVHTTMLADNDRRMDLSLQAVAAQNNLSTTFTWDYNKEEEKMSGVLNARTSLYLNSEGKSEAHVVILPSHALIGDAKWVVEPSDIVYNADKLTIDHFAIAHQAQHIIIDGVASESADDSLVVDLNGVEMAYILDLANFTAVSFSGQASGQAYVAQAFKEPTAWARLTVENFEFENGRMGTLNAEAEWNRDKRQIDIHAVCDDSADGVDAKTYIDGYVSPPNDNIDLSIRGHNTYIDFLNTYSSSFLNGVTGHATGSLRLVGPLGEMDLLGTLSVDGQATVTALGTTYMLSKDTVEFIHNDILLNNTLAYDRYQNQAVLNGGIHHENLSNMTFDLNIRTDKLMAYDFPETQDELFYGTVFASGEVDMKGRPGEVTINCDATTLPGTVFTYNAANPDVISDQSFITWRDGQQKTIADRPTTASKEQEDDYDVPTDLHINFLVNTIPDATMRLLMDARTSDYITLGGSGVIRATYYNKGAFQMFGTYTVDHGTYGITIQNIIKKNFTFQPGGTIVFGGAPFDANLNLQAQYTVNGVSLSDLSIGNSFSNNTVRVNCLMNISGQAGSPQVDFDLDMPTVNSEEKQMIRSVITSEQEMNQQVLYLLGIGRFYTQGANNANSQQQYGQSQLAMQSFLSGTLSTQINELLSQVLKMNNWNFGANISTGNEGWHNAEYEGVVSGRMMNNRLLINGQFGYRDNATQATPSFIGDFDIRYLLHPNGNLALKVYNQTNDRYFTHSSLNTQGIGVIMKKDFNGLSDLFRHRKRKNAK